MPKNATVINGSCTVNYNNCMALLAHISVLPRYSNMSMVAWVCYLAGGGGGA
jgi:hypothetical protein